MTTCTPIYQLPVVEGSDRPCDIDDWSCDFAAAVETQLDILDAVVNRTATTVPMAIVAATVEMTLTSSSSSFFATSFDSVLADTDDMFDSSDPLVININTAGIYSLSSSMWGRTTGAGTQQASWSPYFRYDANDGLGFNTQFTDGRNFSPNGLNFYNCGTGELPLVAGSSVVLSQSIFLNNPDTLIVERVQFNVVWLGDLA